MEGGRLLIPNKAITTIIFFLVLTANVKTIVPTSRAAGTAPLDPIPSWLSSDSDWSYCAVWGDVNNDGYLDLAVGNYGQNDLYINYNGNIETTPSWTSTDSRDTYELAWGDVDNDGDLDLAAANFGIPWERNVLYFNRYIETGGTTLLEPSPSWVSDEKHASRGLAFADLDKDGDIDLAVGNLDYFDRIYKNHFTETGGTTILETTPSWNSTRLSKAYKVRWGDMNNDGYLDLAVANSWKGNVVYLNNNGVLETDPSWQSSDNDDTASVAWGDVDNDGDLDLAAGNLWDINCDPAPKVIYYNINGTLETTPSWRSSDTWRTFGVAWGDVDNDGYIDLAASSPSDVNTLYRNNNGILETTHSWSSADSRYTVWLEWGDMDNDGDLDLAAPNQKWEKNVIYINNYEPTDNKPPIADAGSDLTVNEADIVQFDGSASFDPDGSIASYEWDFDLDFDADGDGDPENDIDSTGPAPTHIYGDNGIFTVTLKVADSQNLSDSDTCNVTVLNLDPTVTIESVEMNIEIGLRVAGRKFNDIGMTLFEDGVPVGYLCIERVPGSPNNQMAWIPVNIYFSKSYCATVTYIPENPLDIGSNPVWIYLKSENGSINKIHHTFNVQQSKKRDSEHWNHVEPWEVNLNGHFIGLPFEVVSHVADPGSDDELLMYVYDSQIVNVTYLNNPPNLDPCPSPQVNPRDIIDTTQIAYEGSGILTLQVEDDDGGIDIVTSSIG